MIGKTISHYKIIEKLGQGGMGVVYKAEDLKLKRKVALKFLPLDLTCDSAAKERFIHEAQTVSALEHPNICTVYEIDKTEDGQLFICMAYYDGETLKEMKKGGPFKLKETIDVVIQVVEGLAIAHETGITHRDIKPANIIVTKRKEVKIVDFGLAKLAGQTSLTKAGTTMGTVAYKSPEQTRGEEVDHRTDIWSIGVVLYEMISGQLPFKGEYEQAVVYSILNENVKPIAGMRADIPLELEMIVNKCLEKDPDYRYQAVSDLLPDLKRAKRELRTRVAPFSTAKKHDIHPQSWFSKRNILLGMMLVIVSLWVAIYFLLLKPKISLLQSYINSKLIPFTSGGGLAVAPSWSPDGKYIAYASDEAGNMDIWKKPIDGGPAIQLTTELHNESYPSWSPDGNRIAFYSDKDGGGIFIIDQSGGEPTRITINGTNPIWSPNIDTLAYYSQGNIYVGSYTRKNFNPIIKCISAKPYLVWTKDGKKLIFWHRTMGDIHVVSVDDSISEALGLIPSGEEVAGITLSENGQKLIFSKGPFGGNKDLWQVPINPKTGKATGKPLPRLVTSTEDIQCAFSPVGNKLAFTVRQLERHLWAFPIDTVIGLPKGEPVQITLKGKLNYYPAFSYDGKKLVWTSHRVAKGVLYWMNLKDRDEIKVTYEWGQDIREVGGSFCSDGKHICYSSTMKGSYQLRHKSLVGSVDFPTTRTQHPIRDVHPAWAPEIDAVAFYSNRSNNWDIWSDTAAVTRVDQPKQLTNWKSNEMYPIWSPDSRYIYFQTDKGGNADIWVMDSDGGNPHQYVSHPAEEDWSAWSPNGRWFYFTSNRSGVFNVWVKPKKSDEVRQFTTYEGLAFGLPESGLFTKFAVSHSQLVVPLETRKGDIYILENVN